MEQRPGASRFGIGWAARVCALLAAAVGLFWLPSPRAARAQGTSPAAVPASRKAQNVAVITIKDEITSVTAQSLERRITLAERSGADAIVFEIDTPGGDLYAALTICGLIKKSRVPNTVAWINTKAYSAGAVIALACREIVVAGSCDFGDALPIARDPMGGMVSLGQAERQKITAPLLAEVVDSARRHGYDEFLVQGMVSLGVELWLVEHVKTNKRLCVNRAEYVRIFGTDPPTDRPRVASTKSASASSTTPAPRPAPTDQAAPGPAADSQIQPASPSIESTMRASGNELRDLAATRRPTITAADAGQWKFLEFVADGSTPVMLKTDDMTALGLASDVVSTDQELEAFFGAKNLRRIDRSWSEGLVTVLTTLWVRGLLIAVFLIALFIEMTHPGLILPGGVALVALFGLLGPPFLIGMAGWWEVAAIIGGIVLILLEIFVIPGFGVPGIVGVLALFGGLIGTFLPNSGTVFPNSPQERTELLGGLTTLVLSFATAGVGIYFIAKNFGSLPLLNRLVLKSPESLDSDPGLLSAMGAPSGGPKVGAMGVALTPLRPAGRAQFGEHIYDVVADQGFIPANVKIRVVSADEFRTAVEEVRSPTPAADHPDPGARA